MIAFILTMPHKGSWNGKWSGDSDLFCKVRTEQNIPKEIIGKNFTYSWDDGWTAMVSVSKVSCNEGYKLRKKSKGFCGYDWMIDSIIKNGVISP